MRVLCSVALLLTASSVVKAQEAIPRDEALKAAFQLCRDLPKLLDTPIPTDPDVKRPVGIHGDNRGVLILPESGLASLDLAKVGAAPVAIAQMWMLRLTPQLSEQPLSSDKLKKVTVSNEAGEAGALQFTLAVRKVPDVGLELVVYGKDQEPLWTTPLAKASEKNDQPIDISAELQGNGAALTLKLLGAYTVKFAVAAD